MKQSRLAQRKLGIKPTKKTKKINFLKPVLILSFVLIIFGVLFFIFSPKSWDGKSRFAVVSQNPNGDVVIEILDPLSSLVTNLTIPASTEVEAARQLGTWKLGSITRLGIDKNLGSEYLKNTVIKSFRFPIDASVDLSIIDKIRIKLFLITVGGNSQSNLNLKDTDYIKRVQLVDGSLGWRITDSIPTNVAVFFNENFGNNINVSINNASGIKSEGSMTGKVLEVMGLNVASIQNLDKENSDCKITSLNQPLASKIAKIFNCSVNLTSPANNFDMEINLGTNFAQRF